MSGIDPSLNNIRDAYIQFNTLISEEVVNYDINDSESIKKILENADLSQRLDFLISNKKQIKAHWSTISRECPLQVVAYKLIFQKTKAGKDHAHAVTKALEKAEIDTYTIFRHLQSTDWTPEDKFEVIKIFIYENEDQLSSEIIKDISLVITFLCEQPGHRKPISLLLKKIITMMFTHIPFRINSIPTEILAHWLELIEPQDRPSVDLFYTRISECSFEIRKKILSLYKPSIAFVQKCISLAILQKSKEFFLLMVTFAQQIPDFEFGFSLNKNCLIALREVEPDFMEEFIKFLRANQDLFAELMVFECPEVHQYLEPNTSEIQLRNLLHNNYERCKREKSSLSKTILRNLFTYSLKKYDRLLLDLLWDDIGLNQSAIERLFQHCANQRYRYSALYLSRKLDQRIDLVATALQRLHCDVSLDVQGSQTSNKAYTITIAIEETLKSTDWEYLIKNIEKFPILASYVLNSPQVCKRVKESPTAFFPLMRCLYGMDIHPCLMFLRALETAFLARKEGKDELWENFKIALTKILLSWNTQVLPTVLFGIIKCAELYPQARLENLLWVRSSLKNYSQTKDKEECLEIYRKHDCAAKTVLCYFDYFDVKTYPNWKELFKDLLQVQGDLISIFYDKSPVDLILLAIEIDVNHVKKIPRESLINLIEMSLEQSKYNENILNLIFKSGLLDGYVLNLFIFRFIKQEPFSPFLEIVLQQALAIPNFSFSDNNNDLQNASISGLTKILLHAMAVNDFTFLYDKILNYLKLFTLTKDKWKELVKHCNSFEIPIVKPLEDITDNKEKPLPITSEFSRQMLYLNVILSLISKGDVNFFIQNLDALKLNDTGLSRLLELLNTFDSLQAYTLHVLEQFSPTIRAEKILEVLCIWDGYPLMKENVLGLFQKLLNTEDRVKFFSEPSKYGELLAYLPSIANLGEILDHKDIDASLLIECLMIYGKQDPLIAVLNVISNAKLIGALSSKPSVKKWFDLKLNTVTQETLLSILKAIHLVGLLNDEVLLEILHNEPLNKLRKLRLEAFKLCSEDQRKKFVTTFGNKKFPSIFFDVIRDPDTAFAEAIFPYIDESNISEILQKTDSEGFSILSKINRSNFAFYKRLLPLIPPSLLREMAIKLTIGSHCQFASIDKNYVPLIPQQLLNTLMKHCVNYNHGKAFVNALEVFPITHESAEELVKELPSVSKENNSIILFSLLVALRTSKNHVLEFQLVNRLLQYHKYKEVQQWMSGKLQGENYGIYCKVFMQRDDLCRMLFDASGDDIVKYVRSLSLGLKEQREQLPFLGVKAILNMPSLVPSEEVTEIRSKVFHIFEEVLELERALDYVYKHILERIKTFKNITETAEERNLIAALHVQLDQFISELYFDDIVLATSVERKKMIPLLSFLPLSKVIILIPLLEKSSLNYFLQSKPLDVLNNYLMHASAKQKEDFILNVGLNDPSLQRWLEREDKLKTLLDEKNIQKLERKFRKHHSLLAKESYFDSILSNLKKTLVDSEETTETVRVQFNAFKDLLLSSIKNAKQMLNDINALSSRIPNEYLDHMTASLLIDPIQIKDSSGTTLTINKTTLSLLKNFKFEILNHPLEELKMEISKWLKEHPNYSQED